MSKTKSLEEAWAGMRFPGEMSFRKGCPQCVAAADRVRALLLVGLEEARAIDEAPTMARAGLYEKQQRRIEALGK